ncbi:SDR family oxidoreductase [Marinobacter nauticus]|uniref:SDR family oxidoreductase n=1 Tax=Marinobacter nauticus TaxID=2743 RepID=UPI004043EAB9
MAGGNVQKKSASKVYITGGASGIGLELARSYLRSGAEVTLFDIQPMESAVEGLAAIAGPASIRTFAMDVTKPGGVREAFASAAESSPPDLVIHCAGIAIAADFEAIDDDAYARVININLVGTRNVVAGVLPHLKAGSQLVLVASMAGLVGCYGYAAYCASKYGVVGLAEVLRIELATRGIDVSVVCPPEVETPMVEAERLNRPRQTEALKLMAGTLPLNVAVAQIRKGIDRRRFMIIPGWRARGLWFTNKLFPGYWTRTLADYLVSRSSHS